MQKKVFILIGNDETLKNQIYTQITGVIQFQNEENYNPFPQVIKQSHSFKGIEQYVLNTPPIKTKEDHKMLWSLIATICQCHKLIIEKVFYFLLNQHQVFTDILVDLKVLLFYSNYSDCGIYFFTNSKELYDQMNCKNKNTICFQILGITDLLTTFKQLIQSRNNVILGTYSIGQLKIDEQSEINCQINALQKELKGAIIIGNSQALFITKYFQTMQLEQILKSFQFNFDKIFSIFEYKVIIKFLIDQLFNQIMKVIHRLILSTFYQCSECLQLYYFVNSTLYHISQNIIETVIANPESHRTRNKCIQCQNSLKYISFQLIIQKSLDYFEQKILLKLSDEFKSQPKCNEKHDTELLKEINMDINVNIKINNNLKCENSISVLFLANEDDIKKHRNQQHVKIDNKIFFNGQLKDRNCTYIFHNPPLFDFDITNLNEVDTFKTYFSKNPIHIFVFFLNYQRTEIMKSRYFDMFKKLPNLNKQQVFIFVTSCDADVDQQQNLKKEFQKLSCNSMVFLKRQINQTVIKSQILDCFSNANAIQFQFQDTIFEKQNAEEDKKILNNFREASDQIKNDKLEELYNQQRNKDNQIEELNFEIEKLEKILNQKKEKLRNIIQEKEINKSIIQQLRQSKCR
ncbi:unnamed protein product (macronuclear) [Paramecium tetraurelia]|uniref:Uncharacterized protein n=1 Tax=Paramecium tetraurelia TaxID=5888 RepID=A0BYS6_PARTE|nr:uncharacterized protein GSPATT00033546001 [Paramecium tetraurelia]CAK63693.1 unnamed protein product [Paramecium tetraurelia]|eukprot:XP_001431091.1 hypothetical protein (macronuclear) [Paramecium tetraurelia strain d4-2]